MRRFLKYSELIFLDASRFLRLRHFEIGALRVLQISQRCLVVGALLVSADWPGLVARVVPSASPALADHAGPAKEANEMAYPGPMAGQSLLRKVVRGYA